MTVFTYIVFSIICSSELVLSSVQNGANMNQIMERKMHKYMQVGAFFILARPSRSLVLPNLHIIGITSIKMRGK